MKKNVSQLINETSTQLLPICKQQPIAEQEAWWLIEHLTKKKKAPLLLEKELTLTDKQCMKLESWIAQRVNEKKPLQYIIGSVPFCGLEIITRPPVLIPRPETEEWCSWLIKKLSTPSIKKKFIESQVLDLCCGTGCIALALAKALPKTHVVGTDITADAIALSEENKHHNKIVNATFLLSDLYQSLAGQEGQFDLIIANPPYLSEQEWQTLSEEVRNWEDPRALIANEGGLGLIADIITDAPHFLRKNTALKKHNLPQLVIEIGHNQATAVLATLQNAGFTSRNIHKDLEGKNRWVSAAR